MIIKDIIIKPIGKDNKGTQIVIFFPNDYGASIIKSPLSYGGDEGLFEIAVIKGNRDNWELCYDTPITNDVLGYLDSKDINKYLEQIEKL